VSVYYTIATTLGKVCLKAFARLEVQGQENVPRQGPLLLICNHIGNADVPLIACTVPRPIQFMAKGVLFKGPIGSNVLSGLGAFPLGRDGHDLVAVRWTLRQLEKDRCVGILPEGSRSRDGLMRKGAAGVTYIALKSQAPILPVALWGSEKIPALWRIALPLTRLNVRIGQPFTLPSIDGRLTRPVLEHLTDMAMQRIAIMLPEKYRGYYALNKRTDSDL